MFNVEEEIITFLNNQGFLSYADVPNPRPDGDFLTVERTGGQDINVALDNPTIAIQCWSNSRYNASQLALSVTEVMELLRGSSKKITCCRQNSLYNFPYENQPRYQIMYDIVNYKE
jgi:hypothetical protein